MHVMIVACYHPLPLSWHFNPYILQHFSENVFKRYLYSNVWDKIDNLEACSDYPNTVKVDIYAGK